MTMSPVSTDAVAEQARTVAEQGYIILRDVIEDDLIDDLHAAVRRLEQELSIVPADNDFEGTKTLRTYNLLAHAAIFQEVPVHPAVLPLVEHVLDPACLVSTIGSVNIGPGESAQPIHADDQMIPFPPPHPAVICNTMWALTDFTAANGATRLVPGSHLRDHPPVYGAPYQTVPAEMRRGSVLVWHGSLWHGGGANETSQRRIGISMNYCAGYLRQEENQQLGIPPGIAQTLSPRLQELVGYGVFHGVIGHIEKKAPRSLFGDSASSPMAYETERHRKALKRSRGATPQ
jgi:ectoine hydroxylase-related dioxygenase (phytanoyl-CoA dioxygenase family)